MGISSSVTQLFCGLRVNVNSPLPPPPELSPFFLSLHDAPFSISENLIINIILLLGGTNLFKIPEKESTTTEMKFYIKGSRGRTGGGRGTKHEKHLPIFTIPFLVAIFLFSYFFAAAAAALYPFRSRFNKIVFVSNYSRRFPRTGVGV